MGEGSSFRRLSSFYFLYFAFIGGLAPFFPVYLQFKGFNPYEVGSLMAIVMATKMVAPNLWGWLADHTGKRITLIRLGSFMAMLLFAALLWVQGFWLYALIMAAFSAFWNAVLPQTEVVTLANLHEEPQRYARVRLWGSVGFIMTVNLLGVMLDLVSIAWLGPWLLACLLLLFINSLELPADHPVAARPPAGHFRQMLKRPDVWPFFLMVMLLQLSFGPYYTFFSLYLESYGYDRVTIGLLWSLGVLCEIVLFTRMHTILAQVPLVTLLALALGATSLRWFGIAWLADSIWWLLPLQALHAFSFGVVHASSIEFIRRVFGHAQGGQGQALYSAASFGLGGAIGAWLAGWLVGQYDHRAAFFMGAGAAFLATLITGLPALRRSVFWRFN